MTWRSTLSQILLDQMIEQGGIIDLNMAEDELHQQCPGRFHLDWTEPTGLMLFEVLDQDKVNVVFDDDGERVEWLLKWA